MLQMRASETGGSARLFDGDVERSILWIEGTVDLGLRNRDGVSANDKSTEQSTTHIATRSYQIPEFE